MPQITRLSMIDTMGDRRYYIFFLARFQGKKTILFRKMKILKQSFQYNCTQLIYLAISTKVYAYTKLDYINS